MEAIVFCGIQGAGKTTLFVERFLHTHVRVSLDVLRTRHREGILLHACLAAGQRFVVDNTNATVAARKRYLDLARASGFRAVLYHLDVPLELALERNARRAGAARVPEVAVRGAARKLEVPTEEEGFDELVRVVAGR